MKIADTITEEKNRLIQFNGFRLIDYLTQPCCLFNTGSNKNSRKRRQLCIAEAANLDKKALL